MGVLLHTAPLWQSPRHTLHPPSYCSCREAGLRWEGEGAEGSSRGGGHHRWVEGPKQRTQLKCTLESHRPAFKAQFCDLLSQIPNTREPQLSHLCTGSHRAFCTDVWRELSGIMSLRCTAQRRAHVALWWKVLPEAHPDEGSTSQSLRAFGSSRLPVLQGSASTTHCWPQDLATLLTIHWLHSWSH